MEDFASRLGQKLTLQEIIEKRRSVRKFQQRPVPDAILDEVIRLAIRGPSAGAIRGFKVFITKENLAYDAPACLVICTDPEKYASRYGDRGRNLYAIQDAAIVGAYLTLLLVERGLSSVWIGAFREGRVQRLLGTTMRPVAILAVGYEL